MVFTIHWHESAMGLHVFPILNLPPTSLPSHPSGSSQCTSPEHPVSCIRPGLGICFTYDNIHVSMLFSQIIPLSPSLTESKRLFYTSVSFLLSRMWGYCYHFSKFNIHALVYCTDVFLLTYFTLYNRLQFHPPHENWFKCILFNGWVIFHCVYVPLLSYPFICWWTAMLLPCPGYYTQCCDEHWGARVSCKRMKLEHSRSGFLGVCAQQWDCWVIWQFYFQYFKESPQCYP